MRTVFERDKLLEAFQTASAVVPTRTPKEVLENVRLEISGDRATLLATDLEVAIRTEVSGVQTQAPGVVLLPAKRFGAILREWTEESIQLESTGEQVLVRGQRASYQLPTVNPDEFPAIDKFDEEAYHSVPTRFLHELIRRTVFATDPESTRYALGGVLLEFEDEKITAVATDGRRLAKQEGAAEAVGGHKPEEAPIVPSRAMQLVDRCLDTDEETTHLAVTDTSVKVRCGRTTVISRVLEGRFPRWRDVFPKGQPAVRTQLPVGEFHSAVRQAAIVTSEESRAVTFSFAQGRLLATARGGQYGESHVELPIGYEGPEVTVALDWKFLVDFLRVLEPEQTFTIQVFEDKSPVLFSVDDGYAYLVMPMKR